MQLAKTGSTELTITGNIKTTADYLAIRKITSAGVVTTDLATATHFRRHSKAGMVMVNLPTAGVDFHVPFGGRGDSSHGPREQGFAAIDFFTSSKTAYTLPGTPS